LTTSQRELLKDYLFSLAISFVIAAVFVATFGRTFPKGANVYLIALISGWLFGTAFFMIGTVRSRIHLRRFSLNILAHAALVFATIAVCFAVLSWLVIFMLNGRRAFDPEVLAALGKLLVTPMVLGYGLISVVGAVLINSFFQINRKLGPGVLWNWITGRYYSPKEEERIFMFMDMRDSTSIAEQIGNLKFSALVRDFFHDLTIPLLESRGEVSTYVGDEAVITWKPAAGLAKANCIELFFRMKSTIFKRAPHYVQEYGFIPDFKAGLHIGPVVATEVGEVKSEIVFHGDVLNTAARIQALCNSEGIPLLVSGELAARLELPPHLTMRPLGCRHLKGKEHEMEIYAIEPASNVVSANQESIAASV
jgi:adenylate cyclase